MNVWDFVNAINQSKEDLFIDPQADKDYIPFIVNKSLSNFPDTLFYSNEINCRSHISKKMQFDFLRYSVTKKKRFSKWNKKDPINEDVMAICDYYKYSVAKGYEVMSILTKEQIEQIKSELNKGGRNV